MSETGLEVFDTTVHKTNEWLNDIQEEMGWGDRGLAYHALRATLQSLRDRILLEEVANFGAQLPILVRGIYYDGWVPSANPMKIRDRQEFLDLVEERYGHREPVAFDELVRAVFETVNTHVPAPEVRKLRDMIGKELQPLWPEPREA